MNLKLTFVSLSFVALTPQIHRIVTKNGGHFTLMVVGESGVGKTTREFSGAAFWNCCCKTVSLTYLTYHTTSQ